MPGTLIIATCQHAVCGNIRSNLSAILKQIRIAKSGHADIAHFSESNLSGYAGIDFDTVKDQNYKLLQISLERILELASELKIAVIIGSHHFEMNKKKPYNCLYYISNTGKIEIRYDKRFLYGAPHDKEVEHYSPGNNPGLFEIKGIKCGMLICHEWRYPELYREYKKKGVQVIFQSWYDGNLSTDEYKREGKELGELIPGTVRGNAANNHLWISASNTSRKESSFPSFMVRPDGRIHGKLSRNRSGVLLSSIDTEIDYIDPSAHNRNLLLKMKESGY